MENTIGLLTSIFLISTFILFVIMNTVSKRSRLKRRMDIFLPANELADKQGEKKKRESAFKLYVLALSKVFRGIQFSKKTQQLLIEAGSLLRPEEFLAVRVLIVIGSGLFLFVVGTSPLINIAVSVLSYWWPVIYMNQKRKKRLNLLSYQLIETLGMMANSMRAGFSFMQAMQLVAKEMPAPIGPEFERVVREVGLGVPLDQVLLELTRRLPNKELAVAIQAILSQRKSGGNLAELMEKLEETIRSRVRILEELKTLTAQGKMSSLVITFLPVGLGLYLYFMSPEYFNPIIEHPLGWMLLSIGAISLMIGWFLIRKIIRIEV